VPAGVVYFLRKNLCFNFLGFQDVSYKPLGLHLNILTLQLLRTNFVAKENLATSVPRNLALAFELACW
jgi:hypothetical protein